MMQYGIYAFPVFFRYFNAGIPDLGKSLCNSDSTENDKCHERSYKEGTFVAPTTWCTAESVMAWHDLGKVFPLQKEVKKAPCQYGTASNIQKDRINSTFYFHGKHSNHNNIAIIP